MTALTSRIKEIQQPIRKDMREDLQRFGRVENGIALIEDMLQRLIEK